MALHVYSVAVAETQIEPLGVGQVNVTVVLVVELQPFRFGFNWLRNISHLDTLAEHKCEKHYRTGLMVTRTESATLNSTTIQ